MGIEMTQMQNIDHSAIPVREESARAYAPTLQFLHWFTAALMFSVIPVAWVMVSLPEGTALRPVLFGIHKSIGVIILICAGTRVVLRTIHPAPVLAGRMGALAAALARASHVLLYVVLLAMPISGYLMSADGVHSFPFFGLFTVPHLPKNAWVESAGERIHLVGQWAVYGLIMLHLMATAWHVAFRRDGILNRMLPQQRG
jgi:cytochrome b561